MRLLALVLAASMLAAGCIARGEDPYAYAKKPLYSSGFDLARLGTETVEQQFRVQDGSIGAIRVQVWVNATAGGAQVEVVDPSGRTVLTTDQAADRSYPLTLGQWRVRVTGVPDEAGAIEGQASVHVTRA